MRVILVVISLGQVYIQYYAWVFSLLMDTLMETQESYFPFSKVIVLLGRPVCPAPLPFPPPPPKHGKTQVHRDSVTVEQQQLMGGKAGFQHRPSLTPNLRFLLLHHVAFPSSWPNYGKHGFCLPCRNHQLQMHVTFELQFSGMFFCPQRIPFFMSRPVLQTE